MHYIKSEYLVEKPKYNSIKDRREEEFRAARAKAGLLEKPSDVKDLSKDPGLKFIEAPKILSKTLLDQQRKEDILNDL